jgi:hypothetical protein
LDHDEELDLLCALRWSLIDALRWNLIEEAERLAAERLIRAVGARIEEREAEFRQPAVAG